MMAHRLIVALLALLLLATTCCAQEASPTPSVSPSGTPAPSATYSAHPHEPQKCKVTEDCKQKDCKCVRDRCDGENCSCQVHRNCAESVPELKCRQKVCRKPPASVAPGALPSPAGKPPPSGPSPSFFPDGITAPPLDTPVSQKAPPKKRGVSLVLVVILVAVILAAIVAIAIWRRRRARAATPIPADQGGDFPF